jgi:SAM-dependent methyltransferase
VADPVLSRLRDRLPLNPPYDGPVAQAYDAWIPVDDEFADDDVYLALIEEVGGPVLELGCGTGRPLLRWLQAGHEVEGIDSSADMLAILAGHAADQGLDPIVHHGGIAPLDLPGRSFAAIVCPAGTFSLIHDPDRALEALQSYHDHLRPDGLLALTMFAPADDDPAALEWRIRRTGTTADGTTYVVHEAARNDRRNRVVVTYHRLEAFDPDGRLTDTWLRRHHLRWWPRPELEELLADLGFVAPRSIGDDHGWVTIAAKG